MNVTKTLNSTQKPPQNHEQNPIHIFDKIDTILNPTQPISTSEAHKQCNKAIGTIDRQASSTLNEKLRDIKPIAMTKAQSTTTTTSK